MAPVHCHLLGDGGGGGMFLDMAEKIDISEHIFFSYLSSTLISIQIETGCTYFTHCEPFDA